MKFINYSFIAPGVKQPFEAITWFHLQEAYKEAIAAKIIADIGSTYTFLKVYVLWGCEVNVGITDTDIAAGAVFCNGQVYLSPAQTRSNPTGGHVIVANFQDGYNDTDSPSGTLFSDSSYHHVHVDRIAQYTSAGASGTGNLNGGLSVYNDISQFVYLQPTIKISLGTLDGATLNFQRDCFYGYATPLTGGTGFTLDFTNARIGAEIIVQAPLSSTTTITISDGGAISVEIHAGYSTLSGMSIANFRFKYLGKPAGGSDYYSIEAYAV